MAGSVPTVITFDDLKHRLANAIRIAKQHAARSGDFRILDEALRLMREVFETEFKTRANLGKLERSYVNEMGAALEKAEANVASIKAKRGL